jgi:hypothetical protein
MSAMSEGLCVQLGYVVSNTVVFTRFLVLCKERKSVSVLFDGCAVCGCYSVCSCVFKYVYSMWMGVNQYLLDVIVFPCNCALI